jgi:hypothetical protein
VFSNPMREPIQDGGELDKREKREGKLVVASGDAVEAFYPAEEVFDVVAATVIAPMKRDLVATITTWGNAHSGPFTPEGATQGVSIKSLVGDRSFPAQTDQERLDRLQIMLRSGGESQRHRAPSAIDDRRELGVQASFGQSDGLAQLAASGIGPMLM